MQHTSRFAGPAALTLSLALSGCHPQPPPRPEAVSSAPAPAPLPAQSVLTLYSGSLTGLVVGAGAGGGNPGAQLAGQTFVPNPGLPQTYIWAFAPGAAILDRDCRPITVTQAINMANAPVANAARFAAAAADGRPASPVRVQLWAKGAGTPPACGGPQTR